MKKIFKTLAGVAVIGAAVGAIAYFFTKNKEEEISDEDFVDEFDDVDEVVVEGNDASGRNYATLNSEPVEEFGEVEDAPVEEVPVEDTPAEEVSTEDEPAVEAVVEETEEATEE